jgi:hypothetical protein
VSFAPGGGVDISFGAWSLPQSECGSTNIQNKLTTFAVNYLVERTARAAGFDNLHPHCLRHSCGYALADKGIDLRTIQEWLGHRSIEMTVRFRREDLMGCGVSATDWRFVRAPGGGLAGSLQGPSAAAVLSPIPAETGQRYSKRSRLTVLLWPQVQNYSLTKLRLILAGAMALAIQRFRGSSSGWGIADWKVNAPPWPSVAMRRSPTAKWAEAARTGRRRGRLPPP